MTSTLNHKLVHKFLNFALLPDTCAPTAYCTANGNDRRRRFSKFRHLIYGCFCVFGSACNFTSANQRTEITQPSPHKALLQRPLPHESSPLPARPLQNWLTSPSNTHTCIIRSTVLTFQSSVLATRDNSNRYKQISFSSLFHCSCYHILRYPKQSTTALQTAN